MEKVEFKEGQLVTAGYVEIDGVKHTVVEAEYEGETPLSPFILNKIQDNAEKELITAKTTEYAEELIIKDSAPVNGVINIKGGKSVQATTKGNQLVDFNKTYSMGSDGTYKFENDVLTYKSAGTSAYSGAIFKVLDQIKNNPGKILNFCYESFDVSKFNSSSSAIVQLSVNVSGTKEYVTMLTKDGTKRNYTIPNDTSNIIDADLVILTQGSTATTESTVSITKPMLQFGTDKLEYEQYTGGVASPNINYRQEVESIGDNKQLFNINATKTYDNVKIDEITDKSITVSSTSVGTKRRFHIECYLEKGTYTIQRQFEILSGVKTATTGLVDLCQGITWLKNLILTTSQEGTFEISESGTYNLRFTLTDAETLTENITVKFSNIKIEKGIKATGHTKYGQGSISISLDNGLETTDSNYQSQTIIIPTQKPFRAIGDVKDTFIKQNGIWYEKHNIGILNTLNLDNAQISGSGNFIYFSSLLQSTAKFPSNNNEVCNLLSNISLKASYNQLLYANVDYGIAISTTGSVCIRIKECTTLEEYKTKLQGINFELYYILATPELIECTEEQKEALYQLEHTQMYENLTYITCTNEIKPEIKATYLYNNDLNKYYGTRLDAIESRLHILEKG